MEDKEILYDHYKDTFEQQKGYLAKRNQLTVLLMVIAVLLIGLIYDPDNVSSKVNTLINAQVDKLYFDFNVINTGLILAFFWFSLQYYMVVLQIEKMYKYIKECEDKLSNAFSDFDINREGAYYLKSYPWLKVFANEFFVLGIPIGFIILTVSKIINEWNWTAELKLVDIVFLALTTIFSLLYISNRKLHEEFFDAEANPNISFLKRLKRYFTK